MLKRVQSRVPRARQVPLVLLKPKQRQLLNLQKVKLKVKSLRLKLKVSQRSQPMNLEPRLNLT